MRNLQFFQIHAFDVTYEKFQTLPLPNGIDLREVFACDVGEHFALIDVSHTKICLLEDLESGKWNVMIYCGQTLGL